MQTACLHLNYFRVIAQGHKQVTMLLQATVCQLSCHSCLYLLQMWYNATQFSSQSKRMKTFGISCWILLVRIGSHLKKMTVFNKLQTKTLRFSDYMHPNFYYSPCASSQPYGEEIGNVCNRPAVRWAVFKSS